MGQGIYFSIYLRKKDVSLLEALDRIAEKTNRSRNDVIVKVLGNAAYLAGELND